MVDISSALMLKTSMHDFIYKNSELYCEGVPVSLIAKKFGTPFYLYSHKTLLNHLRVFDRAFDSYPHIICFALKACSSLAILRLYAREGVGADVVSGGELFRAIKAGMDPKRIVHAGVGKTEEEILYSLKKGILMFNVESSEELKVIDRVAKRAGLKARVALRVNPDIDVRTHPYIATGLRLHKFGIPIEEALESYRLARRLLNIEIIGIHKHIGSQLVEVSPFVDALKRILILVEELRSIGIKIKYIDIGGGLGITYNDETPPHPQELAKAILPIIKDSGCTLILEPGRVLVGNAGILVTKVLYLKRGAQKNFVIVDAGMNDLIRPTLYGAYQRIIPVKKRRDGAIVADVVGPICESADFLAKGRRLARPKEGDLLAVMSAGAYGFTMASNYNSRPRIPEVLVKGKKAFLIREREDYEDLIKGERIPGFLKD
jgi:diaminopimelate decarboxylase